MESATLGDYLTVRLYKDNHDVVKNNFFNKAAEAAGEVALRARLAYRQFGGIGRHSLVVPAAAVCRSPSKSDARARGFSSTAALAGKRCPCPSQRSSWMAEQLMFPEVHCDPCHSMRYGVTIQMGCHGHCKRAPTSCVPRQAQRS